MQNRAIEIHDSTLDRISVRDGDVVLHFAAVYIHQSAATPGVDAGSCWIQKALLRMDGAVVSGSFSQLPRELLDGQIKIGTTVSQNMIPIPLDHKGDAELRLESWNDEAISIAGSSARLELIGDPKYVEEFQPNSKG